MQNKKILISSVVILMMFHPFGFSKIRELTLKEMIERSEIIIVGKVINVIKKLEKNDMNASSSKAIIKITSLLKGGNDKIDKLTIYYSQVSANEYPAFYYDEECILFVRCWKDKYQTVQGYAGKIKIENGQVIPHGIRDEKEQSLDIFLKKIQAIVK